MLAEIYEAAAEQHRIPQPRDSQAPVALEQHQARHYRGREMVRRHRGPGVRTHLVLADRPRLTAKLVLDLEDHTAHVPVHAPELLRGPPRWSRRHEPIADQRQVERRREPTRP